MIAIEPDTVFTTYILKEDIKKINKIKSKCIMKKEWVDSWFEKWTGLLEIFNKRVKKHFPDSGIVNNFIIPQLGFNFDMWHQLAEQKWHI